MKHVLLVLALTVGSAAFAQTQTAQLDATIQCNAHIDCDTCGCPPAKPPVKPALREGWYKVNQGYPNFYDQYIQAAMNDDGTLNHVTIWYKKGPSNDGPYTYECKGKTCTLKTSDSDCNTLEVLSETSYFFKNFENNTAVFSLSIDNTRP